MRTYTKKISAMLLIAAMLFRGLPVTAIAEATAYSAAPRYSVTGFAALPDDVAAQSVPLGTSMGALVLPDTLPAMGSTFTSATATETATETDADEEEETELLEETEITITGVTWQSEPEFDPDMTGAYVFSPTFSLPEGYSVVLLATPPTITVTIGEAVALVQTPTQLFAPFSLTDGTMILTGVTAGGLRTAVESDLQAAGQSSGSYDYTVVTSLTVSGELNAADYAFIRSGLTKVRTLDLTGIASFIASALSYNTSVVTVKLPQNAVISDKMFERCTSLTTIGNTPGVIDLSDVASFGKDMLRSCTAIKTVKLPPNAVIPDNMFVGCTGLTTIGSTPGIVDISDAVSYGSGTLSSCSSVETVKLRPSPAIPDNMFYNCTKLTTIGSTPGVVDISDAVSLGSYAFFSCIAMETVKLPENTAVPMALFYNCTELTTIGSTPGVIDISDAINLGANAFYNCTSIEAVRLPENAVISSALFAGCTNLHEVNWQQGFTYNSYSQSFYGCALDFTDGYPAGSGWTDSDVGTHAGNQIPRAYFSLDGGNNAAITVGDPFTMPAYTLKTKEGMDYQQLVADKAAYSAWLNQSITMPVTTTITHNGVDVDAVDANTPGVYVITYSIPVARAANTHSLIFTLTVGVTNTPWISDVALGDTSFDKAAGRSAPLTVTVSGERAREGDILRVRFDGGLEQTCTFTSGDLTVGAFRKSFDIAASDLQAKANGVYIISAELIYMAGSAETVLSSRTSNYTVYTERQVVVGINGTKAATTKVSMGTFGGSPVSWYLIKADASTWTLLAESNLGISQFHASGNSSEYAASTLKTVVNDLLDNGFSATEQLAMNSETLSDLPLSVSGQKLWPLSYDQADAVNNDLRALGGSSSSDFWWLRSPNYNYYAWCVRPSGELFNYRYVDFDCGIRPAFNLNLSSVLIISDSSLSGAEATSLSLTPFTSTDAQDIKLTLDSGADSLNGFSIASPGAVVEKSQSDNLELAYSAGTNNDNFIRVQLSQSGVIKYAGIVASGLTNAGGTASIPLTGVIFGIYDVSAWVEQGSAAGYTNIGTTPVTFSLTVAAAPTIAAQTDGTDTITLVEGYQAQHWRDYTITGVPTPIVAMSQTAGENTAGASVAANGRLTIPTGLTASGSPYTAYFSAENSEGMATMEVTVNVSPVTQPDITFAAQGSVNLNNPTDLVFQADNPALLAGYGFDGIRFMNVTANSSYGQTLAASDGVTCSSGTLTIPAAAFGQHGGRLLTAGIYRAEIIFLHDGPRYVKYYADFTLTSGETTYALTVVNGSGGGDYVAGAQVTITANTAPSGKVFDKWTGGDGGTFNNANSATTTFTMPGNAVTVTAAYKDAGSGSNNGSSGGSGGSGGSSSSSSTINGYIICNVINVPYSKMGSSLTSSVTGQTLRNIVDNAFKDEDESKTVKFSYNSFSDSESLTSLTLTFDASTLGADEDVTFIIETPFGMFIFTTAQMLEWFDSGFGTYTLTLEKSSLKVDVRMDGKSIIWNKLTPMARIGVPYTPETGESTANLVVTDKDAHIPSISVYEKGMVYADIFAPDTYKAVAAAILGQFVENVTSSRNAEGWSNANSDLSKYVYYNQNGNALTGWQTIDGDRYYFGSDGVMSTGWLDMDDKWYCFYTNGKMIAGKWEEIGGKWYYFYEDGMLAVNATIDGYEVGADGAQK